MEVLEWDQFGDEEFRQSRLLVVVAQEEVLSLRRVEWLVELKTHGGETRGEDRVFAVVLACEEQTGNPTRVEEVGIFKRELAALNEPRAEHGEARRFGLAANIP